MYVLYITNNTSINKRVYPYCTTVMCSFPRVKGGLRTVDKI